ncbi:MAG: molybdopterin cofactor-binding domain-containing protein, partial [Blastocatellia bacterium]
MNETLNNWSDYEVEPERYELTAAPAYHFEMPRRDFFKALGCGVLIVFALNEAEAQQESGGGRRGGATRQPQEIGAWLHVGENGAVTVYTGKVEVGQGIRTSLAQVVAEELRVPITTIQMVMGDTDLTPYDAGTFGSQTTPGMSPRLRRAAAAAREALLDLAAEQLKADRSALLAVDGKITNSATKQSVGYGQLTKGQKLLKAINDNVPLTPHEQWKVAGKPI